VLALKLYAPVFAAVAAPKTPAWLDKLMQGYF
jgi:hypothetical protein